MKRICWLVITTLTLCILPAAVFAVDKGDVGYTPTIENLEAREWFQDAKFGLFVHWGVYSLLENGEWVMHRTQIPKDEYVKVPKKFYPYAFDADEWCQIVKDAGMQYITITSKHHDGFAMYDSDVSPYNIVDATPFKRDVLKELADACKRHGLKLFFYYSQLDWQHEDYYPRGRTGGYTARPESGEWYKYLDYMDLQLRELLTGYGNIGGIWFDGMWDKPDADWRLGKTYKMIHDLQPATLIGSNHHISPISGEDFQMFEKGLPGDSPHDRGAEIGKIPLETCDTINHSWGYNASDRWNKKDRELIHYLIRSAGMSANLLLNVGPLPDGTIHPAQQSKLKIMGEWLKKWGETIYGTRSGPYTPAGWGVSTQKGDRVFVHVLTNDAVITLPDIGKSIKSAKLLNGAPVKFEKAKTGTIIQVPSERPDPYDTIIEIAF